MIVEVSSTASSSCAAETVTVWAVFQVDVVKESEVSSRVTSLLLLLKATVTVAVGFVASFTVKVPVVEPSATVSGVLPRVSPGSSSSSTVTAMVGLVTLP